MLSKVVVGAKDGVRELHGLHGREVHRADGLDVGLHGSMQVYCWRHEEAYARYVREKKKDAVGAMQIGLVQLG